MRTPLSVIARRRRAAVRGGALPVLALAALFALVSALPADAQASRTRPSGGTSSGTASGSGGRSSSPPPAATAPAPRSPSSSTAPSTVGRTRPGRAAAGGRTVIERDARGRRPDRDVVIVDPWGWWSSYWWSYGAWGWYPGYYGPYYGGYGPAWYPRRVNDRMGALDLDLKPGDTQIFLDGQPIGVADRFDGWPGYLWLEEGDYHFVFYREGYRTIAREYRVRPGLVIDVEDRLERGESVPPEELVPPQPTPRRDARIRRNEEMRRQAAEAEVAAGGEAEPAEGGDWRDRAPDVELEDAGAGTLRLVVEPPDASVYLDGRFLGTGVEVARLRRGLAVSAGEHLLEVVRPGHAPVARRIIVEDGREVEVEVALEPQV
ncbi:MAG TPA: PEGA domain-containing protein [Thermoanaerobaculia bacterium]